MTAVVVMIVLYLIFKPILNELIKRMNGENKKKKR